MALTKFISTPWNVCLSMKSFDFTANENSGLRKNVRKKKKSGGKKFNNFKIYKFLIIFNLFSFFFLLKLNIENYFLQN